MAPYASIADLPPEILSQIFSYFDSPAPSESLLHEQPHGDMLRGSPEGADKDPSQAVTSQTSVPTHLKSISRVSRKWREMILPTLFSSVLWRPQMTSLSAASLQPVPMLDFLLENGLSHHVAAFTLVVDFAEHEVDAAQLACQIRPGDLGVLWGQIFSVIDPLRFTIIAPPTTLAAFLNRMLFLADAWSFDIPYHILSLARPSREISTVDTAPARQAPPRTPAAGASCHQEEAAAPSPLFSLRPWTSILLNEGSSIRAYQTYEFFLRQPPSMLSALLGIGEYPNNEPLLPPTITDFNYIAIFPLASHVHTLLLNLPRLDRFFVQLTPRPSNRILQDQRAMRNIDMADLWMERNTAYSYLFAALSVGDDSDSDSDDDDDDGDDEAIGAGQEQPPRRGNWPALRVFESGDAADKESWNMAVDFLRRSGVRNWVVERDGVLVRTADEDGDATGDQAMSGGAAAGTVHHLLSEESLHRNPLSAPLPPALSSNRSIIFIFIISANTHPVPSLTPPVALHTSLPRSSADMSKLSQGAIRRIAFNGVARLPYSSMLLYVRPDDGPGPEN